MKPIRRLIWPSCTIMLAVLLCSACTSESRTTTGVDDQATSGDTSQGDELGAGMPAEGPIACKRFDAAEQVAIIQRINAARAKTRNCGNERFAATTPLTWNTRLEDAARRQSDDMATNNFFGHTGSNGSDIGDRIGATGYRLRAAGENIAAGQSNDQDALTGWLDSPGHCRNIMSPGYREMAMACSEDSGTDYTRYWTQVFATPQ